MKKLIIFLQVIILSITFSIAQPFTWPYDAGVISPGSPVYTPRGTAVKTWILSGQELTAIEKLNMKNYCLNYYNKVSFYPADHSAITTNQQGILESKWTHAPVFRHTINDCPYNSSTLTYYRYNQLCTSPVINFTNQTVNTNQTVTACIINVQNVTVTNNKNLILDFIESTTINSDFEVQLGSELEIK